ncbi:deoxyribodipyrimidine photo-lyase [Streptomyces sulfonofaciens]|uniref:Deoxyribodipyrimidine photo-lyase n=1 Tax=Streptomyces sulfonofaciens TaxID=68272 RepID=A0A919FQV6_9ACTN|nr:deoxyribodipyrimidine photo-lyase [Streptomyces sulfonofaciens]GHH70805.1 deoxyribodipyrimidine photo-lyase [Streptomyces sulfonofaciens]
MPTAAVALFTADLRLHDNPVLHGASGGADAVVPLFVRDGGIGSAGFDVPNRRAFLADCLADLDAGLRRRGGRLVLRSGDVVEQTCRVAHAAGARDVHVAADVSGYAQRRTARLRAALAADGVRLHVHEGVVTALPPAAVTPQGKDHFAVFTPYFRRWSATGLRSPLAAPRAARVPDGIASEPLPHSAGVPGTSPGLAGGGERAGRRALSGWLGGGLDGYADRQDDLSLDGTSRLSPHLHFGTLSAAEVVHRARGHGGAGAEAFVRQLAWRDFHHQVLAARPDAAHADYRTRHDRWRRAPREAEAWRAGRTGYPVVDAAMRQLRHEGWMHNRARLLVASFLTKTLYVDWRVGARHFLDWLVDGDVANNQLNWQWVAGTGTDTRPHRVLNPLVQARRFDPDGDYVRRWVPELAGVEGRAVHRPWLLPGRALPGHYPEPIVDLAEGLDRFRTARGLR